MQGSLELAKDLPKVFKCLVCGKNFCDKKHAKRKYCSPECQHKGRQKRNGMTCHWCGKKFKATDDENFFCSRQCYDSFRAEKIKQRMRPCKVCGTMFDPTKHEANYCSNECWRRDQTAKLLRFCVVCGQMFVPWRGDVFHDIPITCSSKCLEIYSKQQEEIRRKKISLAFRGANHPAWLGGKQTWRGENWKWQRSVALKRDGYKCCSCGISNKAHKKKYKSSLEVHHIKPFRFFENDYMAANDLENLITLCISCHKKAEYEYYRRHPDVVCRKHRSY